MKISSGPLTRPVPGRKGSTMIRLGVEPEVDMPLPRELELLLKRESLLVLVKGETGMGKTTAALELVARLQGDGDTVHISTRSYPDKLVFQHALFSKLAALPNVHFFSTLIRPGPVRRRAQYRRGPPPAPVEHAVAARRPRLLGRHRRVPAARDTDEGRAVPDGDHREHARADDPRERASQDGHDARPGRRRNHRVAPEGD